jgi:hypothetical protein
MSTITIKQTQQEQDTIQKQLDAAMLPCVLDWKNENNIYMFGGYMRSHYMTNNVLDLSFGHCWAAIKTLKDSLIWVVAPHQSAQAMVTQDERSGKVIRDLRRERIEHQEQEARDARERSKKPSMHEQAADAAQRVAVNQKIETLRNEIQSVRGRTHGQTFRIREELTKALEHTIKNKRTLIGVSECEDEFRRIIDKFYKD